MSFEKLPPEIRIRVYSNLLSRNPRPFDRWFAPNLRSYNTVSKLYPAILRVSKLIHREASPVLYHSNTLTLDLRKRFGNVQPVNATQWDSDAKEQPLVLKRGTIYPEGLQSVRHVEIRVDEQALWTEPVIPIRFTVGEVVRPQAPAASKILVSLLSCLAAGNGSEKFETEKKKTLKLYFVLQQNASGGHLLSRFVRGYHDETRSEMMGVLRLFERVKTRRDVEVEVEVMYQGVCQDRIDVQKLELQWGKRWGKRG